MKRFSAFGLLLAAALLAVVLAPGLVRAQATPQDISVTLTEFTITPNSFTVMQGQPVRFSVTNTGKFPHSISFTKDGKFLTVFAKPINGGTTGVAEFTFEEAGTWQMYCPVANHAEQGMTGQVVVMAAGVAGAPGMPSTGQPGAGLLIVVGLFGLALAAAGVIGRRLAAARQR